MRSWIGVVGLLLGGLGWSVDAAAQSITLSTPASSYVAPANFSVTITTANGTGSNKYRVQGATLVLTRNNQTVHTGTAAYAETNLPVGTYSYKATATAFNPVTLHEYVLSSNTINITVTAPPAPTGTVTATPNPCDIAMGSTTCSTTVSWNSNNSGASVWVTDLNNNGAQLFANGQSGAQAATWITAAGSRFHLKVGSQTLNTVDVLGNAPPPPSGSISGTPNPCTIAPGTTSCLITVNWSSVNAPTAAVWVSDLNNNGMAPYGSTPSGSQGTLVPASTGKRMHLKFGALTLATVDIHAGAVPPPSGTLTASSPSCDIAPGNTACPVTISWNTSDTTAKVSVRMAGLNGAQESLFGSGPTGTKPVLIVASGTRFQLLNGTDILATVTVGANAPPAQPSVTHLAHKTETIEYQNDPSKWVMGQVKRFLVNGTEASRSTFDAATVLPVQSYSFGKLLQTLGYYADGTIATVKDGNNNITTLSNWYRGVPRTIQYPATPETPSGATQTAVVNDNGWITVVIDENGFATNYGHDAMGRLTSIVYPTGDSTAWNTTTQNFIQINSDEHGLAPGHWRSSRATGNGYLNIYYDAMWRPVLEEKLDLGNVGGTISQVVKRYDVSGRLAFQSYPANNVTEFQTVTQGTRTFYDALDRVTGVEQDSELGVLASTTEYLTGFQTITTNPRGNRVQSGFQAYDQPSYDLLSFSVYHEGGKVTEIFRHPHLGSPEQIRQRNSDGTLQQSRYYAYDGYRQLCKTTEPETGATLVGYDGAGNVKWSAAGLASGTACEADGTSGTVAARKVSRTYDARNRLKTLTFPDGNGNQSWDYTPDGLPSLVTTTQANVVPTTNSYSYNKRRLLTNEQTSIAGTPLSLGYAYDSNGSLSVLTYPNTLTVNYAPNALGQATQAGSYATGVQYYPNGGIKQFTYGNGIVHTMQQNARQLPSRSIDSGNALDHQYTYDANANVTAIFDNVTGTPTVQHRYMTYDGLDRLTAAGSAMFGGSDHYHRFTYDALDNLKSWKQAGLKDYAEYVYDAKNQLINIKNTAGATVVGIGYDEQGNVNNKNGAIYDFDYGNRLRSSDTEWYAYDAHGRRILNCNATACDYQQYAFDGKPYFHLDYRKGKRYNNIYLAGSVIAIREAGVNDESNPQLKYQHTDALGSPVAVTDAAGAVIDRTNYEPYGVAINKPAYDGIGYTGHVMDGATGLTYMQQRYYDPKIGRFLSVDPVTASSGTGANFNRYWYANNNPYRFVDPDGRLGVRKPMPRDCRGENCSNRPRRPSNSGRRSSSERATPSSATRGARGSQKQDDSNGLTINWKEMGRAIEGRAGPALAAQAEAKVGPLKAKVGPEVAIGFGGNQLGERFFYSETDLNLVTLSAGKHSVGLGVLEGSKDTFYKPGEGIGTDIEYYKERTIGYSHGAGRQSNWTIAVGAGMPGGSVEISVDFERIWNAVDYD